MSEENDTFENKKTGTPENVATEQNGVDAETNQPTGGNASGYGYGYGYNGYGYNNYGNNRGYGYTSGYGNAMADSVSAIADAFQNRTIADYVTIFRERIWYLILAVFIVVTAALVYTYNVVPEYTAAGRVQLLRQAINLSTGTTRSSDSMVMSSDDLMTQVEIMKSTKIIERVQNRLTQEELSEVVDPYRDGNVFSGPMTPTEVIAAHSLVKPDKGTMIVTIGYTHRTKEVAKKMADYFIDEICKYNMEIRQSRVAPIIESTRIKIAHLEKQINNERHQRIDIIKRNDLLNIDMGTVGNELVAANSARDGEQKKLDDMTAARVELEKMKAEKTPLYYNSYISQNALVAQLISRTTELRTSVSSMSVRYGDNHPQLLQAKQELASSDKELGKAVDKAVEEFNNNYTAAQRRLESAKRRAKEKAEQIARLREASTELEALDAQLANDSELLQRLRINLEDQSLQLTTTSTSIVQLLDSAGLPNFPSNKKFFLNAVFGVVGGLVIGSGIVLLLSFFDDKIKSAKDVETTLGLPLLTAVPKINAKKREKATAVSGTEFQEVKEAFIAMYSALKLGEFSASAKVVAITSTTPSEGKTFVAENLAQTYAMHDERVLLIDADLRLPNVANTLELDTAGKGINLWFNENLPLEDAIVRQVVPNMDVLCVGSACNNPTQIINSKRFKEMFVALREKYDRIIVDTPPIAAVSDILNVLPLCDGMILTVKFDAIQRMMVKANLNRLLDARVPVFGAVLNQMKLRTAHYYTYSGGGYKGYSHYYGKKSSK